eukprot:1982441-Rhodomonas_salina.1
MPNCRFFSVNVCHHNLPEAPNPYTAFLSSSIFPAPRIGSRPFGGRKYHPFATAIAISVLIVIGCAIGANVSP